MGKSHCQCSCVTDGPLNGLNQSHCWSNRPASDVVQQLLSPQSHGNEYMDCHKAFCNCGMVEVHKYLGV